MQDPRAPLSSQKHRLIKLSVQTESYHELLLDSFSGREAISEPFSFQLSLLSKDARLELKTLVGQPALLEVELADRSSRCIHGYLSGFSYLKSDEHISHYTATLSSWLSHLSLRIDSRIFQNQTVREVLHTVFSHYGAQVSYRFECYAYELQPHSCITQFNETDEQFVRRLLEAEGLLFYFEHSVDGHTMVISDWSQRCKPLERQPVIEFHKQAVCGMGDTISTWAAHRRQQSDKISVQTVNYKLNASDAQSDTAYLNEKARRDEYERYEFLGQYSPGDSHTAWKRVERRSAALHALSKTFEGASNCRAMMPGYTFELQGHPRHDQFVSLENGHPAHRRPPRTTVREFLLLSVQHDGHNNYLNDDAAVYGNTFTCLRNHLEYWPQCLTPRPVMPGPLTATVVGKEGLGEVQTDEWARIKVRFHWQRQQPNEPSREGHPAQDTAWLRVAQPSAGRNFGHQFMPRVGQEVVVNFIAGDINMPLVTAVVYNAYHCSPRFSDAEGARQLPGNNALSGVKTKEHNGDGYNELVFDDTAGELRARLASTHQHSALNLGKLSTPRSDGKAEPLGHGAELRTHAAIALRAAQGLLLTTYARHQAQDQQLGREALLDLLDQCADLFKSLGQTAATQGAQALDPAGIDGLRQALGQWPAPDSSAPGEPVIAVTGEAGIVSATPGSHVHYAGENHDTTAQDHLQMSSGATMHLQAGKGISAFAQDAGISAIANRGQVRVQAQDDDISLNAQKNLHASAAEGEIVLTAPVIRLVADDGSYIRIGGGVEIGTSGSAIVHAADHDWVGPKTDSVAMPAFGREPASQRLLFHYPGHADDAARLATEHNYKIDLEDGTRLQGLTDSSGLTQLVERDAMHKARVEALRSREQSAAASGRSVGAGESDFSEQFQLVSNGDEHLPIVGQAYRITTADGQVWVGVTDAEGMTERVYTDTQVKLGIEALRGNDGEIIE